MAASPYAYTLIETRIYFKQNRKANKKDTKEKIAFMYNSILQNTSDTSGNSYVNNILGSKMMHACRKIILVHMHAQGLREGRSGGTLYPGLGGPGIVQVSALSFSIAP